MVDITCGRLYDYCLKTPDRHWFGMFDCAFRWILSVIAWYYAAITHPVTFFIFTLRYNLLWYGNLMGVGLTCFYFVTPWALIVVELGKKVQGMFKKDWASSGPGRVFFVQPEGFVSSLLWASYLNTSMYVGLWIACGDDPDAIAHSWYDHKTHKDFWRQIMETAGMRMPREMGRSTKGKLAVEHKLDCDLVLKITDSYLGIGDKFMDFGKDYNGQEDVERILKEDRFDGSSGSKEGYEDKDVLLLELVRPTEDHGVHSFDILTYMTPDGPKVLSVLYWGDCTTSSSHSTQAGYTVDVNTETIYGPAAWYSAFFATMEPKRIGTKLPGLKDACAKALVAHAEGYKINPFLKMIGWDAMIMKNNEIVFFEGNFAAARIPRRMFLDYTNLYEFLTTYTWPFGQAGGGWKPDNKKD
jgi:hypothetical protein